MGTVSFNAFQKALQRGELLAAYYFHGDEDLLKDEAVRGIVSAALEAGTRDFNLDDRRASELAADEFRTLVETPPLLSAHRVVIVREVEWLAQKRPRAEAVRAAVTGHLARTGGGAGAGGGTVLVLVQSAGIEPDPQLTRAAAAVAFEPLRPEQIQRWILHRAHREGLEIEEEAAAHLRAAVGDDLATLASEIGKLSVAVRDGPATSADVADLVGVRRGETIHDFCDLVAARRFSEAVALVPHLLSGPGASGVKLVAALGTTVAGLALARSHLDAGASPRAAVERVFRAMLAARPLGLRRWKDEAAGWVRCAERWTSEECDRALDALLNADRRLKRTTVAGDAAIVAEALLGLALLAGARAA